MFCKRELLLPTGSEPCTIFNFLSLANSYKEIRLPPYHEDHSHQQRKKSPPRKFISFDIFCDFDISSECQPKFQYRYRTGKIALVSIKIFISITILVSFFIYLIIRINFHPRGNLSQ